MRLKKAPKPRRTPSPRRARPGLLAALLIIQATIFGAHARAQEPSEPTAEEVVRVTTDLVAVPVSVTDSRGRPLLGLSQSDFEVRDNGRLVEVSHFSAGAERVALLFLLDASGSTRDIITRQRETALAIFSHFGERSRVGVIQFRERPEQTQALTNDLTGAHAAFQIAALPDRRTAIFDAALAAVRAFNNEARDAAERRIVVLLSDGLDTASTTRHAAVIDEARASGVSFYVIHLPLFEPDGGRLVPRRPSKGFRDLAEKTGGKFFVVGDARTALDPSAVQDLTPIFSAIADDLRAQYLLGYHASAALYAPGYHRVEVRLKKTVAGKPRLRQLREGYDSPAVEK